MKNSSWFTLGVFAILLSCAFYGSMIDLQSSSKQKFILEKFEADVSEEACKCPIPGEFQLLCPNKTQCQCIRVVEKCGNPEATQCEVSRLCYERGGNTGYYHGIPVCSPGKNMCLTIKTTDSHYDPRAIFYTKPKP
jgi:hypothetical protein